MMQSSVDCVTITLVLHECSDEAKANILGAAFSILRPGGKLVLRSVNGTAHSLPVFT
jgi:hypothetical protein